MITQNVNFLNAIFDEDEIEIIDSKPKLKLQQDNINFTEDFTDDTGFIYDSDLAEFTGGLVRQKDTRPTNATFYASYNSNINGNWGDGVLTGTAFGGASILGGKLDLAHNDIRYARYGSAGNLNNLTTGTIRFKVTPNYSGTPGNYIVFFCFNNSDATPANNIALWHYSTDGHLSLEISNNASSIIVSANFGVWVPVSGTEYEFECSWDLVTGANRLFINGIQKGTTNTQTGVLAALQYIKIGSNFSNVYPSNFFINDILIFSTIQHTANYTPNWTNVYETIYVENSIILPEMEHVGDGSIKLFNSFSTTETGLPRYILQIGRSGNYLYWNGSTWAISDGTYTQANDAATFNTNCPTLDVDGKKYGQFKIVFSDSNTLNSVSELTANMNVDVGYLTTNPFLITEKIRTNLLESIITDYTISGDDNIKAILYKDDISYYYSTFWKISTGEYAQSNTLEEISAYCSSFVSSSVDFKIKIFFHSDDGTSTPNINLMTITYNFSANIPNINTSTIYHFLYDLSGALSGKTITVTPIWILDNNIVITGQPITTTTDLTGFWSIDLNYENQIPSYLIWNIYGKTYETNLLSGLHKFSELTFKT